MKMCDYNKGKIVKVIIILSVCFAVFGECLIIKNKNCPNYCNCDILKNKNRANCSARNLIDPNIELTNAVEILDLSYNDITIIDKQCFAEYIYLIDLNISHNAIHSIDVAAFRKLRQITSIDLSFNRLDSLDAMLFETNYLLYVINLSGNKFMSLPNAPLISSKSLRSLNLHNSQISQIHKEMFSKMPRLEELDLSNNLLITLNYGIFADLEHIKTINLGYNNWVCDAAFNSAIKDMRKNNATIILTTCKLEAKPVEPKTSQEQVVKFERMVMPTAESTLITNLTLDNVSNAYIAWHDMDNTDDKYTVEDYDNEYDEKITDNTCVHLIEKKDCIMAIKFCKLYEKFLEKEEIYEMDQLAAVNVFTRSDINYAFFVGAAMGMAAIALMIVCAIILDRKKNEKKEPSNNISSAASENEPIALNNNSAPTLAPPRVTRTNVRSSPINSFNARNVNHTSRRRAPTPNSNALIRSNETDARDNFISRLLGRTARQQYYRTMNQNTATLIRRLSRSNLFINRTTSNDASRVESNEVNPTIIPIENHFSAVSTAETRLFYERPETPPPNYGDIVSGNNENNIENINNIESLNNDENITEVAIAAKNN